MFLNVKFVLSITDQFTSFTTKKTYKINNSFNCKGYYFIYLLSSKTCGKQNVGNTTDHFGNRCKNCKSDAGIAETGNMENVKQNFLQNHFLQIDNQGFLKNIEVRLIDKEQVSDPIKRWFYRMRRLRTLYFDGLNDERAYYILIHTFIVMLLVLGYFPHFLSFV